MDKAKVKSIIDNHKQIKDFSCVPSAIEMILKLEGKVNKTYYDEQNKFDETKLISLAKYDGQCVVGNLEFKHQFNCERNGSFDFDSLFQCIKDEIEQERYVIISIDKDLKNFWHMYIIYNYDSVNDEFHSFSKARSTTIEENSIKEVVRKMKGTDILTYTKF